MNEPWIDAAPKRLGDSPLLPALAHDYPLAPSIVLVRTAEAELLRAAPIVPPVLDLCCGDGLFASLIRPAGFDAGCDLSEYSLDLAAKRGIHRSLAHADVSQRLPYSDGTFATIVSNSSLEHVQDVDAALAEAARVLQHGGRLYVTFNSNFAYEWWPCGRRAMARYLWHQPVYHHDDVETWTARAQTAGLQMRGHVYYLGRRATEALMFLDYHFSRVYLTEDRTVARYLIQFMRRLPESLWAWLWRKLFARIRILPPGPGGGVLLVMEKP